jgi:hypothetical protein
MKKLSVILLLLFTMIGAKANDGVFYASGNQLIPISETDISVKKEVLTITRVDDHLEVTVYYEFFNPSKPKDLLVGFEAEPPYPYFDDDLTVYPEQPHMSNFTVLVNGERLFYEVTTAMYPESYEMTGYYKNGKFSNLTKKQAEQAIKDHDEMVYPFFFVYHFNAHFKEGQNIVVHTYNYDLSNSVGEEYSFPYVLTAANRWANHQIDDFTLTINMGERESFTIQPSFFKDINDWTINGKGKKNYTQEPKEPIFHMQNGSITFHKNNFHPDGELRISKNRYYLYGWDYDGETDARNAVLETLKSQYYRLVVDEMSFADDKAKLTDEQKRILKNMPFAYRGHVFKDEGLRKYFESTAWYMSDPNYQDDMSDMSIEEKEWITFWSK